MITPAWLKAEERGLKYQSEALFFGEEFLQDIIFREVSSKRESSPDIKACIDEGWKKVLGENNEGKRKAYGAKRGRYEGISLDNFGRYFLDWSLTDYSIHAALKDNPKYFDPRKQARPLTINSVIETSDNKTPIGLKNAANTDQGPIKSLTAIGFMDVYDDGLESVLGAVKRRLSAEWELPEGTVNYEGVKPLILVDNAVQNFDLAFGVYIPLNIGSNEMRSKELHEKGKFKEIEYVSTRGSSLEKAISDLASKPKTSSGHMIGDLTALSAYKTGSDEISKFANYSATVSGISHYIK